MHPAAGAEKKPAHLYFYIFFTPNFSFRPNNLPPWTCTREPKSTQLSQF